MKITGSCDDPKNPFDPIAFRNAVAYAAVRGARVLSLSVFPAHVDDQEPNETEQAFIDKNVAAIQGAVRMNAFVAVAAGNASTDVSNDAFLSRVAAIDGVIVVAGSVLSGAMWTGQTEGSSYGSDVEIAAPAAEVADGVGLYSTANTAPYGRAEGTSYATPIVASGAALAIAFAQTRGVDLTPAQVECFLKETARIEPKLGNGVQKGRHLSLDRLARQLNAQFPPR
jgi:hypothetical protein